MFSHAHGSYDYLTPCWVFLCIYIGLLHVSSYNVRTRARVIVCENSLTRHHQSQNSQIRCNQNAINVLLKAFYMSPIDYMKMITKSIRYNEQCHTYHRFSVDVEIYT